MQNVPKALKMKRITKYLRNKKKKQTDDHQQRKNGLKMFPSLQLNRVANPYAMSVLLYGETLSSLRKNKLETTVM